MNIKIKIQNYRNIPLGSPIEFQIKDGITFILGVNNVGKSNLLKFFYDFRAFFHQLSNMLSGSKFKSEGDLPFGMTIAFGRILNRKSKRELILFEILDKQF